MLIAFVGVAALSGRTPDHRGTRDQALSPAGAGARDSVATLQTVVDTIPVTVGDPIAVTLRVALPPRAHILATTPQLRDTLPSGSRLLSIRPFHRSGVNRVEAVARVVFFRPGTVHLPVFAIPYRRSDGAAVADTLRSAAESLTVASVLPEQSGSLRDIKALVTGPLRLIERIIATLLALVVLGIAGALVRATRRRRARERRIAPSVPMSVVGDVAYERALAALTAIEDADWLARGEIAMHYELTADVLRRYLAEAHHIPALQRTTPEVFALLGDVLDRAHNGTGARVLLEQADLVKFAGLRPGASPGREFLERSRTLIEELHDHASG